LKQGLPITTDTVETKALEVAKSLKTQWPDFRASKIYMSLGLALNQSTNNRVNLATDYLGTFIAHQRHIINPWKTKMGHLWPNVASQHFNKFMRLNVDNSFMLRVFLNCVYLLCHATC
jgi:hypothetical protein